MSNVPEEEVTYLIHLSPADHARIREARCAECGGKGGHGGQSSGPMDPAEFDWDDCPDCEGIGRPVVVWLSPMVPQPKQTASGKRWTWNGNDGQAYIQGVETRHLIEHCNRYPPHRAGATLVVAEEWIQWDRSMKSLGFPNSNDIIHCEMLVREVGYEPPNKQPPETMPLDIEGATRILATADPVAEDVRIANGDLCLGGEVHSIGMMDDCLFCRYWRDHPGQRYAWIRRGRVQDA